MKNEEIWRAMMQKLPAKMQQPCGCQVLLCPLGTVAKRACKSEARQSSRHTTKFQQCHYSSKEIFGNPVTHVTFLSTHTVWNRGGFFPARTVSLGLWLALLTTRWLRQ